jgi:carotenoid cleavage dioxygenase-like enzyme
MSRPFRADPFLRGNYGPWPMEGEVHDLIVEGEIPRYLDGTLYRNGPNPQFAPRGRYHWFDGAGAAEFARALTARLTRWTLDLAGGTVKEERLDERPAEFPRVDERYTGLRYRHGYASGRAGSPVGAEFFNAIYHYDHQIGRRRMHNLGPTSFTSEPVFVPRSPRAREGEGFLLAVVYRREENRSDLLILDAENVESAPLATVQLPHRVPYGFHGNWGQGL